jgi:23S rRNA pseudouridine2605 synthase
MGTKVDPKRDRVTVRGQTVVAEPKVYYALHKPDAMVCSASGTVDERGRPTILSLLRGVTERVYPVGRLDYHSRGLLLLTNDGALASALMHPRHRVPKIYHVKFQGHLRDDELDGLERGVVLEDGTCTEPATEIMRVRDTKTNSWIQIGIAQGLNRQLRRMGDAIGHPVLKIIRVGIGDLSLDGIEEGSYRPLSDTEVAQLRSWGLRD